MFELAALAMTAALTSGAVGLGWVLIRRGDGRRWRELATALGLEATGGSLRVLPTLAGEVDGLRVVANLVFRTQADPATMKVTRRPHTVVAVTLPAGAASGLRITHEGIGSAAARILGGQDVEIGDPLLDDRLRLEGDDEALVRFVLQQREVRDALSVLMTEHRKNRLENGRVVLEHLGIDVSTTRRAVAAATRLARAVTAASRGPWTLFAARHGLVDSGQAGRVRLEGGIDGLSTQVRVGGSARAGSTVRVDVTGGLPAGLRIEGVRRGDRPNAVRLGDPVLDDLVTVSSSDAELARALLCDDEVRGDLLAVVHQFPGSRIARGAVWLHMPQTDPETVEQGLTIALALARRLSSLLDRPEIRSS